ncbi:MAG: tetratricopeptide repeat protein [Verrucomicrobiota bacterium]|nr:tetratricopeptide repeat protein [Verrucomicrobiota bacterium]
MKWIALLLAVLASATFAGEVETELASAPQFKGLGRHHHPITTKWKLAQRYFDQGMVLLYNFNHAEAIRSFEAAAKVDPECAMAYWGIALALGPNINAPMEESAVTKAWEAIQRAIALKEKASQPERDYIDALATRYTKEPVNDRSELDQAFARATEVVAKKYPEDMDAQVLYAEALMDTSPWNYWQEDLTAKPNAAAALQALEPVLRSKKAHMGADHLYIHLVEAGPTPEKGVPSAERIGSLAPRAGHLVHMASHIYVRVGRYHEASSVNEKAVKVDEGYIKQVNPTGLYPGGYYPHNLHFLWYATDLEGRSELSIQTARKLSNYTLDLRCGAVEGPRQRYLPLLANARFGKWNEVISSTPPARDYPFDLAMSHYARGVAFAALGKVQEAELELQQFVALKESETVKALDNPYFPGSGILAVAEPMLRGKIAAARGESGKAVEQLREAVKQEKALPYMEPPFWYYSARLSLGAALLKAGEAAEAEKVFREDLKSLPANGWALYGLHESLKAQKKQSEALVVKKQFDRAWKHADVNLDLDWF